MRRLILAALATLALGACEARVNTSNLEAFDNSLTAMSKDMDPNERAEFLEALAALSLRTTDPDQIHALATPGTMAAFYGAAGDIKGKSAKQIIKLSYQRQIEGLDQEIAAGAQTLQRILADRDKNRSVFDKVRIDGARYFIDRRYLAVPMVEFRVTNDTDRTISRGFFYATLRSPGRALPWVKDTFSHDFPGGLEPGESTLLRLMPFGAWEGEFSNRADLQLTIELANFEGVDGVRLLATPPVDPAAIRGRLVAMKARREQLAGRSRHL